MLAGRVDRSCWQVVVLRRSLVDEEEPRVDVVVMLAGRPSLVDEEEQRLIVAVMLAGRVGSSWYFNEALMFVPVLERGIQVDCLWNRCGRRCGISRSLLNQE